CSSDLRWLVPRLFPGSSLVSKNKGEATCIGFRPLFDFADFSRPSSKNDLAALRFFLRLGLTRRDPSDLPWLAARHSWLLPWRRSLDSADESLYASSALYRRRSYSRKRRRS